MRKVFSRKLGIFQSRFRNQCTVVCFFTQGSLGWLFFNVTMQKLSQMNYEATCTGKILLPVFIIFLLPQFQLNYHIGQGVYISVESFHSSANALLVISFLCSLPFSVSHPKNKGAPNMGMEHTLCTCSTLAIRALIFLCCPCVPTAGPPGRCGTGLSVSQSNGSEWFMCGVLFPCKALLEGTWALFCQVSWWPHVFSSLCVLVLAPLCYLELIF